MLGTITLTVGQPDGVSVAQKEEAPDNTETSPVEGSPQINGEKMDNETPEANDISSAEEKTTEEKADNANKVGFKKIFSIAGLKFTLKKDKSDETDPVKLLTVKDKEGEEVGETEEPAKDKETEEETAAEEKEAETDPPTTEAEVTKDTDATAEAQPEEAAAEAAEEVKEEGEEKEAEATSSPRETGVSSFRKFFLVSLFSNLRKKSSIKKTKEEEEAEEAPVVSAAEEKEDADQETKKEDDVTGQETQDGKCMDEEKAKEEDIVTEQEAKEAPETRVEDKSEPKEETPSTPEEAKSDAAPEEKVEATSPTESTADQTKPEEQKAEAPAEATAEAEQLSSHEKSKVHGSPLKKLFTGSGLKKLSTKRQKHKKDSEAKPAESGEQAAEHLPSNESEEAPKANSGPSSPETSGEHEEVNQHESSQETDGELASDGEKKKDGVIASFRKLVTPKKHAKRSSDSEDEGTGDKPPKSATLSSSESAPLADTKREEEAKEEKASEDEPKIENTEKLTSSTEETKKKMDTSVSWEALMCMGGPKKRTRKTSDSDDEATKAEEEIPAAAEEKQESKTEDVDVPPQSPEGEEVTPAPEPLSTPPVRESPWSTLKRLVMSKHKPKSDEKPEEPADSEAHKDESSFSLKKLFYGGKKKVAEKQSSTDQGSGEEDSDTPAVVPLSEYEGQVKAVEEVPEEPAVFQIKVSADDRSPSWIPAIVENIDDQHDPLSDIPEEAENSATPKSIDTVPEDEIEEQGLLPISPSSTGRRLSTAEVKPIAPAPDAATSPVPQGPKTESATEVVSAIEAQVSEIPIQSSVTVQNVPVEVASAETEKEPETEEAESSANAVLELHVKEETVAICTGLQTDEIASVTLEQPVEPTVECSAPLSDAANVEIAVEEKPEGSGKAEATEDPVLQAHVHQVQTLELEPVAEKLQSEVVDVQVATESYEPGIKKVAGVSTENSEVIQPTMLKQNSPSVVVDAIAPTPEAIVCTQTVEVAEMTVEIKEVRMELEQLAASQENTPVEEVSQVVAKEVSAALCDTKENAEGFKTAAPAVVPSEGNAVVIETVVLIAPEKEHQTKENDVEKASEKMEKATEEVHPASELVTHSVVIAEAVIKEAVDKVLEDASHLKKSATPPATTETPVKATATTQDEIEITAECVVITDTPVPVVCEKPATTSLQALFVAMEVTETVPLEVAHNIVEKEEEEKPKQSLKMAEEVKVSEGTIIEEEVTEMVEESKGQEENRSQKVLEIHMPTQVILQSADVVEEKPAEVETTVELDGDNTNATATRQNSLPELPEEPQESASGEDAAAEPEAGQKTSGKCAEVMAQVIEEAVKEIEPVSTEITAAS
uniref:A kinase (PRKA) anchor protein (Gravin) 12b n=1 Tax=Nothobranchius korthausae TaxID=1143690 RepID=A0A1A8EPQ0_9TELE